MLESNIQVRLDKFDGPLGLLLHLVQKEEVNIRDLDLTRITDQYLDYLRKLHDVNFDVAGEYLYLAATLLYIKSKNCVEESDQSKSLLDKDSDFEITTKTQLIERLEELQHFQKMGEQIWALPKLGEATFIKPKVDRQALQNSILSPMDLMELTNIMVDLIRKEKRKYTVIKRDRLSIKEKLLALKEILQVGVQTSLDHLIDETKGRDDVVITFISLLELARLNRLEVFQNEAHGNIYVSVSESLDNFDVDTADGFEPEEDAKPKAELATEINHNEAVTLH